MTRFAKRTVELFGALEHGYLPAEHAQVGTRVSVHSERRRHEATVAAEPLFDPANDRLRDVEPVATP
jgi:hypothetical protein